MTLTRQHNVSTNEWAALEDGAEFTSGVPSIIPFARWTALRRAALYHNAPIGVRLSPRDSIADLVEDLAVIDLIDIHFPAFKDGRGFSTARLLRERHGFRGELRASGHVIRDQFLFLHRCGFDAVVPDERNTSEDWTVALNEFSVWYQPTGDGRTTALTRRHAPQMAMAAAE